MSPYIYLRLEEEEILDSKEEEEEWYYEKAEEIKDFDRNKAIDRHSKGNSTHLDEHKYLDDDKDKNPSHDTRVCTF